jgi:hypothetical protein
VILVALSPPGTRLALPVARLGRRRRRRVRADDRRWRGWRRWRRRSWRLRRWRRRLWVWRLRRRRRRRRRTDRLRTASDGWSRRRLRGALPRTGPPRPRPRLCSAGAGPRRRLRGGEPDSSGPPRDGPLRRRAGAGAASSQRGRLDEVRRAQQRKWCECMTRNLEAEGLRHDLHHFGRTARLECGAPQVSRRDRGGHEGTEPERIPRQHRDEYGLRV